MAGWLASLTLEDEGRPDLDLPRVVCEFVDVFPDELPGLPPQRVVDFGIELHPGTLPISMTLHRMALVELQLLRDHQLYAKFSKFEFWLTEVRFGIRGVSTRSVSRPREG